MHALNCNIEIPLSWSWIESVRQIVKQKLAEYDEELRESAVMVASELAENVVKHGEPLEHSQAGIIQLTTQGDMLQISSTNGARDASRVLRLGQQLERLAAAEDPVELYLERLRELLANPDQMETQAGIYRIVCEGKFSLSHTYRDGVLTITAQRAL
jgi:anti-sigma regulatory factor (Ser/Thr protein kinase)